MSGRPARAGVLAAVALVSLPACGGATASAPGVEGAEPVAADYHVSEYGVRLGIRVGFDERRTVTGARLRWDDDSAEVPLHPLDGTDPEPPPEQLDLAPGDGVSLEGAVVAACPGPTSTPVFEVASRGADGERVDRFVPDAVESYERAFEQWCDRSLTMIQTGSMATPAGDYEAYVQFSNPGPAEVEIVSEAVSQGGAEWQRSAVVVAPGSLESMTIRGSGPAGCDVAPPWALGRVLAGGEPIRPAPDGDRWC